MIADAVIAGGGLAGCSAAITLARGGRSVVLLERERAPTHKVCGEFLSAEALDELARLDVSPHALGAVPVRTVRVAAASSRSVQAPLPFPALSLTRRCLDEALLAHASACGVQVRRGAVVQAIARTDEHTWTARTEQGDVHARDLVLATGKHDLRGLPRGVGPQANLLGLKMYFTLAPAQAQALAEHVELLLYPSGYAGLQPVEHGAANLCALIERTRLQQLGGWTGLLAHMRAHCPHLHARLEGAVPLLDRPLAVASIPYGWVRRDTQPGLWCVGDQAAVIPSFTGDGMSIALFSGRLAAESLLAGAAAPAFQRRLQRIVEQQVRFATHLSRALVTAPGRAAARTLLPLFPGMLSSIAARTRLSR